MTTRADQSLSLLWAAYEYLAMGLGLLFLALICLLWLPFALIMRPLMPGRRGRRFGQRIISWGFRLYLGFLRLACASHFDLRDLDALRDQPPRVLVANHPSLLDVVLIVSRLPNVVCVMKDSLMRNILLGSAARLAGYISNKGPLEMVLQAGQALDEGAHVLLFPEGSRTRQFPLDALNNSAALIARRTGIPIQSLLIRFSSPDPAPYLGKGWPLWRKPKLPQYWSVRLGPVYPLGAEPPTQSKTAISPMTRRETAALTARIETEMRYFLSQNPPS